MTSPDRRTEEDDDDPLSVVRSPLPSLVRPVSSARSSLAKLEAFANREDSQSHLPSLLLDATVPSSGDGGYVVGSWNDDDDGSTSESMSDSIDSDLSRLRRGEECTRRELEGLWLSGAAGGWRDEEEEEEEQEETPPDLDDGGFRVDEEEEDGGLGVGFVDDPRRERDGEEGDPRRREKEGGERSAPAAAAGPVAGELGENDRRPPESSPPSLAEARDEIRRLRGRIAHYRTELRSLEAENGRAVLWISELEDRERARRDALHRIAEREEEERTAEAEDEEEAAAVETNEKTVARTTSLASDAGGEAERGPKSCASSVPWEMETEGTTSAAALVPLQKEQDPHRLAFLRHHPPSPVGTEISLSPPPPPVPLVLAPSAVAATGASSNASYNDDNHKEGKATTVAPVTSMRRSPSPPPEFILAEFSSSFFSASSYSEPILPPPLPLPQPPSSSFLAKERRAVRRRRSPSGNRSRGRRSSNTNKTNTKSSTSTTPTTSLVALCESAERLAEGLYGKGSGEEEEEEGGVGGDDWRLLAAGVALAAMMELVVVRPEAT